jgi:alpha-glucosidase
LQAIFWYGRSQDYQDNTETEFFKYVPTVWDETHYLQGEIGESISVARRNGNTWYMGNAAGLSAWKTTIPLNFLKKHQVYTATIYEDDDNNGIRVRTIQVRAGDKLPIVIAPKSGQAIIMRPVN